MPLTNNSIDDTFDIYSIISLAKRLNFTFDDLKEMSFVSLANILYSTIEEKENKASQKQIDAFLR